MLPFLHRHKGDILKPGRRDSRDKGWGDMIRALDKGISVICLKTFGKVSFDAKEGPKGHIVGKKESNNIVFDSSRINEITL